jgi:LPPG:FO 2-phospho-L-lactate transferase
VVIAITPIVGSRALKGPAADMLRDLGHEVSARGVASMYRDFTDVFVLDRADNTLETKIQELGMRVISADTIMNTLESKRRLATTITNSIIDSQFDISASES